MRRRPPTLGPGNAATAALYAGLRAAVPHLRRGAVIQLQRDGGSAPVTVQRNAAFGLTTPALVAGFSGAAADFWRANPNLTLQAFGAHLWVELNAQLTANGVPTLPAPSFGATARRAGGFAAASWTVDVDIAKIAAHPLTAKLSDLSVDQAAEVAGICYHEARHAEQAFLVARVVAKAAKGAKDAKTLSAELGLSLPIVQAAMTTTAPLPGKDALAAIGEFQAIGPSGKHHDYWDWNEAFRGFLGNVIATFPSPPPSGVDKVSAASNALAPTIAGWKKDSRPFLVTKIDGLTKSKKRDALDNKVLGHLKAIRTNLDKVISSNAVLVKDVVDFQARRATAKPLTVDDAKLVQATFALHWLDLEFAVRQFDATTSSAYRAYPGEADAYAVQAQVMKAFKAHKTSKAKP